MLPIKKRRCHSKRTHRLSSAGSNYGDGLESDDEQRRASHNVLERKRRNDLKYSFQVLRGQIPELKDNQRAPKVTILRKAAEYIKQIREEDEDLQTRMAKEKRRETKLLQRLAYLKSLA
jgi:Myc proto-oncogene protein